MNNSLNRLESSKLDRWIAPFIADLDRQSWRRLFIAYVRSLLEASGHRTVLSWAAARCNEEYHRLHHFVNGSSWPIERVKARHLHYLSELLQGRSSTLILDEIFLKKRGKKLIGAEERRCGRSQSLVRGQSILCSYLATGDHLHLASLKVKLPQAWSSNDALLEASGVPPQERGIHDACSVEAELDQFARAGLDIESVFVSDACNDPFEIYRLAERRGLRLTIVLPPRTAIRMSRCLRFEDLHFDAEKPSVFDNDMHMVKIDHLFRHIPWHPLSTCTGSEAFRAFSSPLKLVTMDRQRAGEQHDDVSMLSSPSITGMIGPGGEKTYYLQSQQSVNQRDTALIISSLKSLTQCSHRILLEEIGLGKFEGRSWNGMQKHMLMASLAHEYIIAEHCWMKR